MVEGPQTAKHEHVSELKRMSLTGGVGKTLVSTEVLSYSVLGSAFDFAGLQAATWLVDVMVNVC